MSLVNDIDIVAFKGYQKDWFVLLNFYRFRSTPHTSYVYMHEAEQDHEQNTFCGFHIFN